MTPQPSIPRRYDSSGRRARAAENRRRVIRVAHALFVERGYAGATIADVAARAGVSTPTVFSAFGSKAGLLMACIDLALAGDDAAGPETERPLTEWVYDTADPVELLGRYATMMGVLARQAGPIYDVLVRAADAEPALAALLADVERQRLRAATMLAEGVAERNGLPSGVSIENARDVVWILNAPELYAGLSRKRRWSQRRYVSWARDALVKMLVQPATAGPVPPFDGRPGPG